MRIEIKEKGTPAFYKEIVCALAQYMLIMKKPERKLRDSFKMLKTYIGVCGAFLVLVTALGIFYGMDALTILSIVVLLAAIILSMKQLNRLNQLYRSLQEDTHLSILTLDEEGVELNKEASQLVRMAWGNVAFLRVFDESLCFFGKDARGIVIAVNRNHEKQILDYISDNGIDVKIIGH
ncbi:MAG: hypothetical protein IKQ98_08890 [Erysipelotrichaceae bacterium]|nr:hypothetical protein [Erysipelotrichaceae bacterium]